MAKKDTTQHAGKLDNLVLTVGGPDTIVSESGDSVTGTFDIGPPGYHPGDVSIEINNNKYVAYNNTPEGNKPLSYPEHRNGERLEHWANKLSDSQLEAVIQIYYDRWAFGSGEAIDKIYFDFLDVERTRRRDTKNYGTPTILPNVGDSDTGIG